MSSDSRNTAAFAPLVSIVIPVYNGANFMREAIDSALAQTYPNVEVIVVNDGSADGGETDRIARSYGERIRYFAKENGGVSTALNTGIQNMRGEYFSWLSHDDAYHPDKVRQQVWALAALEDKTTVIKCATEFMDASSAILPRRSGSAVEPERSVSADQALRRLFLGSGYNGCALLIHKSVFAQCGLFDERLRFNQDGFMWSKIFLKGYQLYSCPYVGVKSRIHGGQLTRRAVSLFHKDSELIAEELIPMLVSRASKQDRLIVDYAVYSAKFRNYRVLKSILRQMRHKLTLPEYLRIYYYVCYGFAREIARRMYYSLFRRIRIKEG